MTTTGDGEIAAAARTLAGLSFAVGPYRPPSEGGSSSLLLRVTENCPWNRCTFCEMYKGQPFVYRPVAEILADIDRVGAGAGALTALSRRTGEGGRMSREVLRTLLRFAPEITANPCFATLFHWLAAGGQTAFLQDADSLILRPAELVAVLSHLRRTLGTLTRVTAYTRFKTLAQRKPEDLQAIREAGLDRLHVGLETGDEPLLAAIRKGVTAAEQIAGGRKAMAAGFQLSLYWMPGLGGRDRWREHALNTARAINAINPHHIRSRPLVPRRGTPLHADYAQGRFRLSSPRERLEELRLMVEALAVTSRVCFDHRMNAWRDRRGAPLFESDYEGYRFPEEKPLVLARIDEGLKVDEARMTPLDALIELASL